MNDLLIQYATRREFEALVFFEPTDAFIQRLLDHAAGRRIVDCGAGIGHLSRRLADAGATVLAIDVNTRPRYEHPVEFHDATSFRFGPRDLAVIARPCHGPWVDTVLRLATAAGAGALYVGKPSNIPADLSVEAEAAGAVLAEDAGLDGEVALAFECPIPAPPLRPGERYVKLPNWPCAEPMRDAGTRWVRRGGSWFGKGGEEYVGDTLPLAH